MLVFLWDFIHMAGFLFRPDLHLVIQGSGQGIGVTGYGGVGVDDLSIGT